MIKKGEKIRKYRRLKRKAKRFRRRRAFFRFISHKILHLPYLLSIFKQYYLITLFGFVICFFQQAEHQSFIEQSSKSKESQLELQRTKEELERLQLLSNEQRLTIATLQKVILVKSSDSISSAPTSTGIGSPSSFPTPPPADRGNPRSTGTDRGNSPSTGAGSYPYRPTPQTGGQGSSGSSNPAGGNSDSSWDEDEFTRRNAKKETDPKVWSQHQQYCQEQTKRKQQCDLTEIKSRISEDKALVKLAEKACANKQIQRDINHIVEQLQMGNENPGIGTSALFDDVREARGKSGARVYFRKQNGKIEILAKSNKQPRQQQAVIDILKEKYGN